MCQQNAAGEILTKHPMWLKNKRIYLFIFLALVNYDDKTKTSNE